MKHKHLAISLGAIFISSLILFFSCRKINESTTLGDDLIPPIDNINTFDTLLDVEVYNDSFTVQTDSTVYGGSYTHYIGQINSDPFFGKTDARLYLQMKPAFFPYTFSNKPDSLMIDSVVAVLDYVETYGDTTADQTVNVYEIGQASNFTVDTIIKYGGYRVRNNSNITYAGLLGSKTFKPERLKDSVKVYLDSTARQLRIRLDDSFGQRLLAYDTAAGVNGAYNSDSAFNTKFRGFAFESTSGNALVGFNIAGNNTKLAIYYRYYKNGLSNVDTTVTYFSFGANARSASAQFVKRDYSGTPFEAAVGGTTPDDIAYIQATPGTFARIKIPGLTGLNNRMVHRAELIMEQIYDISDSTFPAPSVLFLDAYDQTLTQYRTIPYDFIFDLSGNSNISNFGGLPYRASDPGGQPIRSWRFNVSRYVQHVVNDSEPAYDLRLSAPFYFYDLYRPGGTSGVSSEVYIGVNNTVGKGRVRLHGGGDGSLPNPNPRRMRLRVIYSKI